LLLDPKIEEHQGRIVKTSATASGWWCSRPGWASL